MPLLDLFQLPVLMSLLQDAHYVFYWCSPTRRALLTGRLPLHQGEMLSGISDDIDLRWEIISQRLATASYKSYWMGKGHTGYKSMAHLPTRRGFANFTGFLGGMQSYSSRERWTDGLPLDSAQYGTDLCGEHTIAVLRAHDPATPLFLYLPWQAVHSPYDDVPGWGDNNGTGVYRGMLWRSDAYVGEMTALLKSKKMWSNALVVFSADNGGRGDGCNFPLRGEKRTNYEGGIRAAAFVSGGLVPSSLRGTRTPLRMHIVDWFPTLCKLAGVSVGNKSPSPPRPLNASTPAADIWGEDSWPELDGRDVLPLLFSSTATYRAEGDAMLSGVEAQRLHGINVTALHPVLVISREVIFVGKYKLLTAQRGNTHQGADSFESHWQRPNGSWFVPDPEWAQACGRAVFDQESRLQLQPCLFDIMADANETHDLSRAMPDKLHELWALLNASWGATILEGVTPAGTGGEYFHARSPAAALGLCNAKCADAKWRAIDPGDDRAQFLGPTCGVPGCLTPPPPGPGPPGPPGPAPPTPPAPPSTDCVWTNGTGLGGKSVGIVGYKVSDKAQCCGLCRATEGCVSACLHHGDSGAPDPSKPLYCHMKDCLPKDCGHEVEGSSVCVPTE